jgi:predicted dehydrogenase
VQAWLRRTEDAGVEDSAVAAACLRHGGLASLSFTGISAHPGERRLGFEMFFDGAYLSFDVWSGAITGSQRDEPLPIPSAPRSLGFDEQAAHFVHCIRTGATPATALHKTLPAMHAVAAAYASAASGAPVSVPSAEGVI